MESGATAFARRYLVRRNRRRLSTKEAERTRTGATPVTSAVICEQSHDKTTAGATGWSPPLGSRDGITRKRRGSTLLHPCSGRCTGSKNVRGVKEGLTLVERTPTSGLGTRAPSIRPTMISSSGSQSLCVRTRLIVVDSPRAAITTDWSSQTGSAEQESAGSVTSAHACSASRPGVDRILHVSDVVVDCFS